MLFAGKVVLVTGSSTGIGEACARAFAESGANVMVSGRHEQRGAAVVEAIRAAGGDASFAAADLRAAGACQRLVGDTMTIVINEKTSAGKADNSSGSKTGSLTAAVPNIFNGRPDFMSIWDALSEARQAADITPPLIVQPMR